MVEILGYFHTRMGSIYRVFQVSGNLKGCRVLHTPCTVDIAYNEIGYSKISVITSMFESPDQTVADWPFKNWSTSRPQGPTTNQLITPPTLPSKTSAIDTVKLRYKAPGYNTIPLITLKFQFPLTFNKFYK